MPFPSSNLSTASQPWGREVEKQINTLTSTVKANEINNAARDNQLNSSLIRLAAAQKKAEDAFNATGIIAGDVTALQTDVTALDTSLTTLEGNVYYPGTTTINGGNIRTGTIGATQISSNYVYAGTVNANQINAGTLTGFTLQTASSGRRVVIGGTTATFYDESSSYTGTITVSGTGNGSVMTINGPFTSRSISFSNSNTLITGGGGTYINLNDLPEILLGGLTRIEGGTIPTSWQTDGKIHFGSGSGRFAANAASLGLSRPNSTGIMISFQYGSTQVGSVSISTTATAYNTSSDYRLKENVVPITDALSRVLQLKPSRFNFISDPSRTVDGFIAHEVQSVVPEAIEGEKDAVDDEGNPEYQGIDQSKLVPLLVASVQELALKVQTLEGK